MLNRLRHPGAPWLEQINNKVTFDSYVGTLERGQKGWLGIRRARSCFGELERTSCSSKDQTLHQLYD